MYCAKCGMKNADYALYCGNDGYDLQLSSSEIHLQPIEAGYCSACGVSMARHAAYCSACGEEAGSHVAIQTSVSSILKPGNADNRRITTFRCGVDIKSFLTRGMLGGVAAVAVLLILSMVISITLNKQIPELMSEENPYIELLNQYEIDSNFTIFGVSETAMAVNLISSSMHINGDVDLFGSQGLNIHMGLIALLVVPFVALVFGGYLSARIYRLSEKREGFLVSMVIGLYYGGSLLIVSRLAGFSKQIGMEMYTYDQSSKLVYSFSWVEALFFGWLLGTLFSWIGYRLYTRIHSDKKWLLKESAVAQAIRAVVIGLATLSLLTFVIMAMKFGQQISTSANLLLAPQLGLYLLNLSHLGTIHFGGEGEKLHYSLLAGLRSDSVEDLNGYNGFFLAPHFLDGYVYCGLFITLIILIWVGYGYVRTLRQSPNLLSSIGIFSVTYGAMMAFLAKISLIGFTMAGGGQSEDGWFMSTFYLNFSMGYVFLTSFIISLLMLLVGSFVSQKLH
ncbi:zinc ribbon domain-containing protein [Paenibacillus donghaensis]|uniref:Uncharacterized protein n=1 Tax=Paenibacillus donghaensis TaxID=414771 RepID=A0A2Z2KJU6_9BACL|nr:zinc ribbon domain-containing protein [Paenibacillus donghaensis]ASA21222.1 hypothetical protein B9T62_10750 [Paenibacillus donghaensis]